MMSRWRLNPTVFIWSRSTQKQRELLWEVTDVWKERFGQANQMSVGHMTLSAGLSQSSLQLNLL